MFMLLQCFVTVMLECFVNGTPVCPNTSPYGHMGTQIHLHKITWAAKYTCTGSHGRPNIPLSAPLLSLVQSPAQGIANPCQVPIAWGDLTPEECLKRRLSLIMKWDLICLELPTS